MANFWVCRFNSLTMECIKGQLSSLNCLNENFIFYTSQPCWRYEFSNSNFVVLLTHSHPELHAQYSDPSFLSVHRQLYRRVGRTLLFLQLKEEMLLKRVHMYYGKSDHLTVRCLIKNDCTYLWRQFAWQHL